MGQPVCHLNTGCHLCVGSTPISDDGEICPNMALAVGRDVKPQFIKICGSFSLLKKNIVSCSVCFIREIKQFTEMYSWFFFFFFFTPQPLRAVEVLFSLMVSGWAGGRREKVCPGCISETVWCRKLILGRDIG